MKDNFLWIFIHPIRSGGGTILEYLRERVPEDEVSFTSEIRYNFSNAKKLNRDKVRFMLGHATYYGIHKLVPNKEPRYFIFLRDPAESVVSYYNAKMQELKEKIPFDVWYKNQVKDDLVNFLDLKYRGSESSRIHTPKIFVPILRKLNYKTFYFLQTLVSKFLKTSRKNQLNKLENAKKLLDACWFIRILGLDEDADFRLLINAMGFKDSTWEKKTGTKNTLKVTPEIREKIYKENPMDVELYNYAVKLRKEKLSEIKKEVPNSTKK